ncbi:MAG: PQQ-binding-like beta-propeller repeat protein [Myxococcales bacterium]|nr:PQQ-binding-like beta-propeller repeat protein [Myxococcales bacterium]MCB9552970.1 PQQ-binding-like beta-propeller repeat protein [Myxococcales bacterium]
MASFARALTPVLAAAAIAGCGGAIGVAGDQTPLTERDKNAQPVPFEATWRVNLQPGGIAREDGEQLATAAYDPASDRVFVGVGDRAFLHAFRASDGHLLWKAPLPGGTSGHAIMDEGRVVLGSDSGEIRAYKATNGELVWRYAVQGAVSEQPVVAGPNLYAVDGSNAIYALDRASGTWRWQYRREPPGRFALFGEGAPTVAEGRVHVGFSDGMLVTLAAEDGAVLWTRDLAPEQDQFEDVDARVVVIGDRLFAASVAGGLYALSPETGDVLWTRPQKGIVLLTEVDGELVAGLDDGRLLRIEPTAGIGRWQLHFAAHEGAPTAIVSLGTALVVTTAEGALHVIDKRIGRPIWRFDPGSGFLAAPTAAANGSLFALANSGWFYAFRPAAMRPPLPPLNPLSTAWSRGAP